MTTRSRIVKVYDAVDITAGTVASDAIQTQRLGDELGAVQIELNQDPGAGSTGNFRIQGRMSPDASWVTLSSTTVNSFQGLNSQIVTDVDMMPQMRINCDTPATIDANTTVEAWIQE